MAMKRRWVLIGVTLGFVGVLGLLALGLVKIYYARWYIPPSASDLYRHVFHEIKDHRPGESLDTFLQRVHLQDAPWDILTSDRPFAEIRIFHADDFFLQLVVEGEGEIFRTAPHRPHLEFNTASRKERMDELFERLYKSREEKVRMAERMRSE
jgi:hypothetical protein